MCYFLSLNVFTFVIITNVTSYKSFIGVDGEIRSRFCIRVCVCVERHVIDNEPSERPSRVGERRRCGPQRNEYQRNGSNSLEYSDRIGSCE